MINSDNGRKSELKKPNCTITERHDELLDKIADARYASRSEALRVAIEDLAQTVDDEKNSIFEELIGRIDKLGDQVSEVNEKLEELESLAENPSQQKGNSMSKQDDIDNSISNSKGAGLDNDVYVLLSAEGTSAASEISNQLDQPVLDVRESLDRLVDRGFVAQTEDEDTLLYRIKR